MHRTLSLWILFVLLVALPVGCDSTGERLQVQGDAAAEGGKLVAHSASPRAVLDQMVRTYQQLRSYQDQGFVRLRYDMQGKRLEDRAPLSVAWQSDGQLGMRAYSVEAGPTGGRWRLRIADAVGVVPNQVLSRAIPPHVDFAWLLNDPLVAERLSAGLAGFPPQLDLLLSPEPLRALLDDSAALSFSPPETIDGRECLVVHIQRGPSVYDLWIDRASMLLSRLRLPRSHLTEQMQADGQVSNIELTIELSGAQANQSIDWERFAVAAQPNEQRVSRFVPVPPQVDTSGLGEQVPGFQLEDSAGEIVYSSNAVAPQRKATVLIWLADHPTCRLASEQLQRVATALPSLGVPDKAIEFVTVWAEPQPPQGMTFPKLVDQWNMPGVLALDRDAMGRDLFNVVEAPTLIVVDQHNRLQLRESRSNPLLDQILPQLLARVARGESLAQELITEQQQQWQRHHAELQMAAAIDTDPATLPNNAYPRASDALAVYPPETFQLRELTRTALKGTALAATNDSRGGVWTLLADGQLQVAPPPDSTSATAAEIKSYDTRWNIDSAATQSTAEQSQPMPRIEVADNLQQVAFIAIEGNSLQLFDCKNEQNRTIALGASANIVDALWVATEGENAERLAVITRDGETLLIDPSNRQQLSGHSPVEPLALLPAARSERAAVGSGADRNLGVAGQVVLADGTLEPLQLDAATAPAPKDRALPKLAFSPAAGPWLQASDGIAQWTLARGWLAADEPAVFLLDEDLRQRWHYRTPCKPTGSATACSVARDPHSRQPVWAMTSQSQTVHLLRADGRIIDHFRTDQPVVGLALVANGERLELTILHPQHMVRYAIVWNVLSSSSQESSQRDERL